MLRLLLPCAAVLLASCAATPEQVAREEAANARDAARLEKRLAGYTPGEPTSCIQPRGADNLQIYGDTLVYDLGNRLYRTQTTGGCFGLKRDDIIVTRSFGSQLCRGDIVRTVDRTAGFPSGACSFGDFVPYTRERRRG